MAKRKGNKKNKRNKLLLLILLLSLSVLLLVMSTYAWFTSNTSVSVEALDVQVNTVNGLQISTDAVNWKARVLREDIISAPAEYSSVRNFLPATLDNVSTIGTVSQGYMQLYHGVVNANETNGHYELSTTLTNEAGRTGICVGDGTAADATTGIIGCGGSATNGDGIYFVAFDLFFKVDAQTDVVLTPASSVIHYAKNGATDVDTGLKNTVRVAFVKEGHVDVGAAASDAQALKMASGTYNNASRNIIIWEPNYDTHTAAGVDNAVNVYGKSRASVEGGTYQDYQGVKAAFSGVYIENANSTNYSSYFQSVNPNIKTVSEFNANQTFDTLEAGVTKYRVYWWVEGQDIDTENGATGKNMKLNLSFAIA